MEAPPTKRIRVDGAAAAAATSDGADEITADEATTYDRQIRLWGLNAQRR